MNSLQKELNIKALAHECAEWAKYFRKQGEEEKAKFWDKSQQEYLLKLKQTK